jgi:ABC-type dipeptide/oligopeptide/nickel transport system ATPase subunit
MHSHECADGHSHENANGRRQDNDPSPASRVANTVFPVSVLRVRPGATSSLPVGLPFYESETCYYSSPHPADPLIDVRGISKYYDTGRRKIYRVFDDLSFKIYEGETLGVCGPSGVGKSTLARCLAGIEKISGGNIGVADSLKRPRAIQFIFQDSVGAFDPRVRIGDSIAEPITLAEGRKPERERIYELMRRAELNPELYGRYPNEISGGQRQRAGIARAISTNPEFLIADEPVSSLDVTTCVKILHLLKSIQEERSLTLLIISHDLQLLMHVSDRILHIQP